jgi:hypothetical protein
MESMDLRMLVKVLLMAFLQSFLGSGNFVKKYLVVSCGPMSSMHTVLCASFFTWANTCKLMGLYSVIWGGPGFCHLTLNFWKNQNSKNKERKKERKKNYQRLQFFLNIFLTTLE